MNAHQRKPNFFIIGAPKSGTTALSEYLRGHPRVFVSTPKEPLFFCEDLPGARRVTDVTEYLGLFRRVAPDVLAVGEASAMYLYSDVAVSNLRRFNPEARIVVMARNPVDLVYAFHSEMIYSQNEDEPDFEVAWELQALRRTGRRVPRACLESGLLQYRDVARLGSQLERLLSIFPREQICIILFDDFIRDTQRVYEKVLKFLDVPSDGRRDFPRINENKRVRHSWIARLTQRPPRLLSRAIQLTKRSFGLDRIDVLGPLRRANLAPGARPALNADFRARLAAEFAPEVELLGRLIDRDLEHWLESPVEDDSKAGESGLSIHDEESEISSGNGDK